MDVFVTFILVLRLPYTLEPLILILVGVLGGLGWKFILKKKIPLHSRIGALIGEGFCIIYIVVFLENVFLINIKDLLLLPAFFISGAIASLLN